MGKNLIGKECGKGICQRKDGLYFARFYAKNGKQQGRYFETLPEAKNWLADARYEERHSLIVTSPDMTVDKWFDYWIENIVCDLAPNTKRNYQERYKCLRVKSSCKRWNVKRKPKQRRRCILQLPHRKDTPLKGCLRTIIQQLAAAEKSNVSIDE